MELSVKHNLDLVELDIGYECKVERLAPHLLGQVGSRELIAVSDPTYSEVDKIQLAFKFVANVWHNSNISVGTSFV